MIDAIDGALGEDLVQRAIQLQRSLQVVAEGLLDDGARIVRASRLLQAERDGAKEAGRHREVVQRRLRLAELLAQFRESRRVAIVAVDIAQQLLHLLPRDLIESAMMLQAVLGALLKLVQVPSGLGNADDGDVHALITNQVLQRGKDLFVGQVARGPKEYEGVGVSVLRAVLHYVVPIEGARLQPCRSQTY